MIDTPFVETVPIEKDADGVIRVGGTRVTLQTVIAAFNRGATPETIVEQYPALTLSDVYLVAGYYLRHRSEVDAYVDEQTALAAAIRRENEARFGTHDLRAKLLVLPDWVVILELSGRSDEQVL